MGIGEWNQQARPIEVSILPRDVLPEGLAEMAPGVELAVVLAGIDRSLLNGFELGIVLEADSRQVAHYHALMYADMAEMAHRPEGDIDMPPIHGDADLEFFPDQIGLLLRWTRRAADFGVSLAFSLERFPTVMDALSGGRIDLPRARALCDGVEYLNDDVAANEILAGFIDEAEELTTGQIRVRLARRVLEHDPEAARERYDKAVKQRTVETLSNPDGTANLSGWNLPADRVAAISDMLDDLARHLGGDGRTMDQKRADVFLDLLEGKHLNYHRQRRRGARRGTVDIRVPLTTLMGLDDQAGDIGGFGPVIADIARQVALTQIDGQWRVAVTDPDTGAVLWNGTTRRRPTAMQRRWVEARYPTCVFPGCRAPAMRSDIDHTKAHSDGGPTHTRNLAPLCRHHHRLKHHHHWKLDVGPDGTHHWTTPHGHTYINSPPLLI